jgi:KUP system potassium uptake protein
MTEPTSSPIRGKALLIKSVGAIGVVYGDIGTSPLYALRECFVHGHIDADAKSVVGIVSLFVWSLICVVVIKYLSFVLRADNHGEGGILALLALAQTRTSGGTELVSARTAKLLVLAGLFGAGLLYGDGMITPAISVLSAVEGLSIVTPDQPGLLTPYVRPITVAILLGLFLIQSKGTRTVGALFGPIMIVWFAALALSAVPWIVAHPAILHAFDPRHGLGFVIEHGYTAFLVLGSVVLCVTGGEALYADMGHFGRRPIRVAWYAVVFPALLASYLGQGARLLELGTPGVERAFFGLFPEWAIIPMVVLATLATVVASQALISGAFSLSRQAVQLGYSPRVTVVHTSGEQQGEIYVPEINWILMVCCIALVIGFESASNLAAAYGVAVTGTMLITTFLFYFAMRGVLGRLVTSVLVVFFLVFDVAFFAATAIKIPSGGWFPLAVGGTIFVILTTWKRGRLALFRSITKQSMPMADFLETFERTPPHRVDGAAVFMTSTLHGAPPVLLHHVKHNKALHEQVVLLSIATLGVPDVPDAERLTVKALGYGIFEVNARYGFMQSPDVRVLLRMCAESGIHQDLATTTFYLGRETLLDRGDSEMSVLRKGLFAFLSRNARPATHFFNIPSDRVVEIGMQVQL